MHPVLEFEVEYNLLLKLVFFVFECLLQLGDCLRVFREVVVISDLLLDLIDFSADVFQLVRFHYGSDFPSYVKKQCDTFVESAPLRFSNKSKCVASKPFSYFLYFYFRFFYFLFSIFYFLFSFLWALPGKWRRKKKCSRHYLNICCGGN